MIKYYGNKQDGKDIYLFIGNSTILTFEVDDEQIPLMTDESEITEDDFKLLFYVQTVSGTEILKKTYDRNSVTITTDEDTKTVSFEIYVAPDDTLQLSPYKYTYGLTYISSDNSVVRTWKFGSLVLQNSIGTYTDVI